MSLCFTPGVCLTCGMSSSTTFVDLTPCLLCFIWPFAVSSDSGKCFEIFSTVRPGKVTRLPFRAAVSNVAFVGKPSAACKNLTTSFVVGNSYTFIAGLATSGAGLTVASSTMGTIHRPLAFLHPWSTGGALWVSVMLRCGCTVTP